MQENKLLFSLTNQDYINEVYRNMLPGLMQFVVYGGSL